MVKVVSVPVHRAWAIGLLGQVGVQCLLQRNSALGRSRRRINARLDLAHQRLRPIAGLAQTDPVASVNLYADGADVPPRSEEHTSELQSLMRISYAVFCLKKKKTTGTKEQRLHY